MDKFKKLIFRLFLLLCAAFLCLSAAVQRKSYIANAFYDGEEIHAAVISESGQLAVIWDTERNVVRMISEKNASVRAGLSPSETAAVLFPEQKLPDIKDKGTGGTFSALGALWENFMHPISATDKNFYISLPRPADQKKIFGYLYRWRERPAYFFTMTLALVKNYKESDTNISPLEMFILFSEFLKLRPSSFIIEEVAADNGSAAEKPVTQLNSKIEVLNASGFDGLAGRVAKTLKSQRFDVLKTGTYSEKVRKGKNLITVDRIEKTGIISYGNIQLAISLKEALDLGQIKVYEKKDDSKLVSVTLILGKDFKEKRK